MRWMRWVNRFRLTAEPHEIVNQFECSCDPDSRQHDRMVSGALRNIGDHCYLEDGVPLPESTEAP
jgi:hypothetical protein